MTLTINGKQQDVPGTPTVADILASCGARAGRVAVLVNGELIPADRRAAHVLQDQDVIEILVFAAGG